MQEHNHSTKNLKVAFLLNFLFTIIEIIGGLWTNSVAILSDAIHDLGDSLSLGMSWYLESKSKTQSNYKFSFGYQRFSLLGALINGLVLIAGAAFILQETIPRLIHPEPSNALGMLLFAVLGILVNGAAVLRLNKGKTLNERMVRWHLLEDVLGWVAVLIVGFILLFWDVPILDPLLSLLILAYVLFNVFRNLKATVNLFLQAVPDDINLKEIERKILAIDQVKDVHHGHAWSLDGEQHVLTIHVGLSPISGLAELVKGKREIRNVLKESGIEHATVEIELHDEDCYMDEEGESE